VTGHSHYEAYAGQWGARLIGLEVGENIAFTQSKLAFARGASRETGVPWSVQVSPWLSGSCTTRGPLRMEGIYARGLDAGHSLSFYERMWLHGWFSGAAMVTPENSINTFFDHPEPTWGLSSHGRKAAEVFGFMRRHDRGIPYTPVGIVLDQYAGYNGYQGRPWGILEPTPGDLETRDLFQQQLFPGSDHIHSKPFPDNPEASYLRPTPFGEMFDVVLSHASGPVLASYPVLLVVGDVTFDAALLDSLERALQRGSRVLIGRRHADVMGKDLARLKRMGEVEILETWTNPATGREAAIANDRLAALERALLPVVIEGDEIGYQVNRNRQGWVVELINNRGVVKHPTTRAEVDASAVAHVTVKLKIPIRSVREWVSGKTIPLKSTLEVVIPAGETRFVELIVE